MDATTRPMALRPVKKSERGKGRPKIVFPEGLSDEAHEARRLGLGMSKRDYAKKIGVYHNTYMNRTRHIGAPRKPPSHNPGAAEDFVEAASEFMRLRPQYMKGLRAELARAEKDVEKAQARVKEIKRTMARFEKTP